MLWWTLRNHSEDCFIFIIFLYYFLSDGVIFSLLPSHIISISAANIKILLFCIQRWDDRGWERERTDNEIVREREKEKRPFKFHRPRYKFLQLLRCQTLMSNVCKSMICRRKQMAKYWIFSKRNYIYCTTKWAKECRDRRGENILRDFLRYIIW